MQQDHESLAAAWRLAADARLAAARDPMLSATAADVDHALRLLLGEPVLIPVWPHQPHSALDHQAPLDLILKPPSARAALRRMLIAEAATHSSARDRAAAECLLRP